MDAEMIKTIQDYFKTQPVLKAWLFGSYARGEETPDSDVEDKESIFELIMMNGMLERIDIREKAGVEPLTGKDQRVVEAFVRKYSKNIIQKWVKFFVMKQQVKSTNITTKL